MYSVVQVHQFGALYQVFLSFRTDNVTVAYLHSLNSHAKASHFGQKQVVLFENFRRFISGFKKNQGKIRRFPNRKHILKSRGAGRSLPHQEIS